MQEILSKVRYFERGLSKILKKPTLFLLPNPVPFNGQIYQKHDASYEPTYIKAIEKGVTEIIGGYPFIASFLYSYRKKCPFISFLVAAFNF